MAEHDYRKIQYEWLAALAPQVLNLPAFRGLGVTTITAAIGSEARIEIPAFEENKYLVAAVELAGEYGLNTSGTQYKYHDYYITHNIPDTSIRVRCERKQNDKGFRGLKIIAAKTKREAIVWDSNVEAEEYSLLVFNIRCNPNEADMLCGEFSQSASKIRVRTETKYNQGGYHDRDNTSALVESFFTVDSLPAPLSFGSPTHREMAIQTVSESVRLPSGSFYETKLLRIEVESGTDQVTQTTQAQLFNAIHSRVANRK